MLSSNIIQGFAELLSILIFLSIDSTDKSLTFYALKGKDFKDSLQLVNSGVNVYQRIPPMWKLCINLLAN